MDDEMCNDYYYHNYQDFYSLMENGLLNNLKPNEEYLFSSIQNRNEPRKVDHLAGLIRESGECASYAKALFCYQSQFDAIDVLEKLSQQFNHVKDIADLASPNFNTLLLAVRSNSLQIVSKCCECWGAQLNFKLNHGSNKTVLNHSFHNRQIFDYLLAKMDPKLIDAGSLLDDFVASNPTKNEIALSILNFHLKNQRSMEDANSISSLCRHVVFSDCQLKDQIYHILFERLHLKHLLSKPDLQLILTDSISNRGLFEHLFVDVFGGDQSILTELINRQIKSGRELAHLDYLFEFLDDKSMIKYEHEVNISDLSSWTKLNVNIVDHPYFVKQIILVKHGIIRESCMMAHLNEFVEKWFELVTSDFRLYQSACSTQRFLDINQLAELVLNFYEHLIRHGYLLKSGSSNVADLSRIKANHFQARLRILDQMRSEKRLSLRYLCIGTIRDCMRSMGDSSMSRLNLPEALKSLIKGSKHN